MSDEYSDSIDQFKKPVNQNPGLIGSQFGGVNPRSVGMQQQPQLTDEELKMKQQQQQQIMQQQQMLRQQAMLQQQQAMQQQAMQQQQPKVMQDPTPNNNILNIKEKFENFNCFSYFQEIFILVILFMLYNNELFKNLIANVVPFINTEGGNYTTMSGIIIAVLLSIIYTLIKIFIFN